MAQMFDRLEADGPHIFFMPEEDEDYEVMLDAENCLIHIFRAEHYKDRFAIHDIRDGRSWQWWRNSTPEEDFARMEEVAITVGTYVLAEIAPDWVDELFGQAPAQQLTEQDIEHLLESNNGQDA